MGKVGGQVWITPTPWSGYRFTQSSKTVSPPKSTNFHSSFSFLEFSSSLQSPSHLVLEDFPVPLWLSRVMLQDVSVRERHISQIWLCSKCVCKCSTNETLLAPITASSTIPRNTNSIQGWMCELCVLKVLAIKEKLGLVNCVSLSLLPL